MYRPFYNILSEWLTLFICQHRNHSIYVSDVCVHFMFRVPVKRNEEESFSIPSIIKANPLWLAAHIFWFPSPGRTYWLEICTVDESTGTCPEGLKKCDSLFLRQLQLYSCTVIGTEAYINNDSISTYITIYLSKAS
jgi:hypothetical protein